MPSPEYPRPLDIMPLPDHHNGDNSVNVPHTLAQMVGHQIAAERIALISEQPQASEVDDVLYGLALEEELRMVDMLQNLLDTRRARKDGKPWGDHLEQLTGNLRYESVDALEESGRRLLDTMEETY